MLSVVGMVSWVLEVLRAVVLKTVKIVVESVFRVAVDISTEFGEVFLVVFWVGLWAVREVVLRVVLEMMFGGRAVLLDTNVVSE